MAGGSPGSDKSPGGSGIDTSPPNNPGGTESPTTTPAPPGGGTVTYGGTATAEPVAPVKLGKLANAKYPSMTTYVKAQEFRAHSKDTDKVATINSRLKTLKSIQDGTVKPSEWDDLAAQATNTLRGKDLETVLNWTYGAQEITAPTTAVKRAIQGAIAGQVRSAYQAVGVDPGTANNYHSLSALQSAPKNQELFEEAKLTSGQTAPLEPFTRTGDLLSVLKTADSTKGDYVNFQSLGINQSVSQAIKAKMGLSDTMSGVEVPKSALEATVGGMVKAHLEGDWHVPADQLAGAVTYGDFASLPVPSGMHSGLSIDGYTNLDNVTSFGSLLQAVTKQSPTNSQGQPTTPGGFIKVNAVPSVPDTVTGSAYMDNFTKQWKSSATFRSHTAAVLNNSGVDTTKIGTTATDYGAAYNAMVKVLKQTPAGQNPNTYVQTLSHNAGGETAGPETPYSDAVKLANKIGANLTNDQLNYLGRIYGESGTTNTEDAELAAISAMYRTDPNAPPPAGSYANTMLQNVQDEYGKYGISLDDSQAGSLVESMLNGPKKNGEFTGSGADLTSIYSAGDAASAAAEEQAKAAAISLFPTLAPSIQQGQTLTGQGGILAPYISQYAQMLDISPDSVNFTDPGFMKAIASKGTTAAVGTGAANLKNTGEANVGAAGNGLATQDEFSAAIMQDPSSGWAHSAGAFNAAASMGSTLMSTMGWGPQQGGQTPGNPPSTTLAGTSV